MKIYVCVQCGAICFDKKLHGMSHATFGSFSESHLADYTDVEIICNTLMKKKARESATIASETSNKEQAT